MFSNLYVPRRNWNFVCETSSSFPFYSSSSTSSSSSSFSSLSSSSSSSFSSFSSSSCTLRDYLKTKFFVFNLSGLPSYVSLKLFLTVLFFQVSTVFLTVAALQDTCRDGRPSGTNTESLKLLMTGGEHVPKSLLLKAASLLPGTNVCQGYGQTETAGPVAVWTPTDPEHIRMSQQKPESCGRPFEGISYKVQLNTNNLWQNHI